MKFTSLFLVGVTAAHPSLHNAQLVVTKYDTNKDGCLEWDEFNNMMKALAKSKK